MDDPRLEFPDWQYVREEPAWCLPEGPPVVRLAANTAGRDFVVGDVHGAWPLLEDALERLDMDPARDRVVLVGDLVDRGPQSGRCTEWLTHPWVHAVRGNHEQMALNAQHGAPARSLWKANGGEWFYEIPRNLRTPMLEAMQALPWAIELETKANGVVAVVHADVPWQMHWHEYRGLLEAGDHQATGFAVWSRQWAVDRTEAEPIQGIDMAVCGHTPLARPIRAGNRLLIDTGAAYPGPDAGRLTIAEVTAPGVVLRRNGKGEDPRKAWEATEETGR